MNIRQAGGGNVYVLHAHGGAHIPARVFHEQNSRAGLHQLATGGEVRAC